jgi:phospholipase/carboxylesterase
VFWDSRIPLRTADHDCAKEMRHRSIVPELKRGGYDVLYREFDGEHSISLEIALEAIGWFTQEKFP